MAIAVSKKVQRNYYDSLVSRGMAPWDARNKVARKIAGLALSIMASGKLYQAGRFKQCKQVQGNETAGSALLCNGKAGGRPVRDQRI